MWREWLVDPGKVLQLRELGVLPREERLSEPDANATLVEWLIAVWADHALNLPAQKMRRVHRLLAALKSLKPQQASLSESPLAGQFVWHASALPAERRLSILSSRLGRDAATQRLWLRELRPAVEWAKHEGRVLVTVEGTTAARPVERLAMLRRTPVIRYRLASTSDTVSWFEQSVLASAESDAADCPTVFVSPCLNTLTNGSASADELERNEPIDRDELLASLGDDLLALKVRPGSTTERLLRSRLNSKAAPEPWGQCWLSASRELIPIETATTLIGLGAREADFDSSTHRALSICIEDDLQPVSDRNDRAQLNSLSAGSWDFLTHWTRAKDSMSLQKLSDAELDELLLSDENCDRSALGVLLSILKQRRIRATAQTIRGPVPVVCFTAMPLQQITEQRTFRTHRGRWDFEHYGLCIRREALCRFGAQPVIYGTDEEFESLSDADRPWFQLRASSSSSSEIDWTIEQEWRMPGDVDLTLFSPDDVVVFVRSRSEISAVKAITNWPVIAIESLMRMSDR